MSAADYFAWGSGDAGWQDAVDSNTGAPIDISLDSTVWNHVVISADHQSKPPVINVWVQGQLVGSAPYPTRAVQCPPGAHMTLCTPHHSSTQRSAVHGCSTHDSIHSPCAMWYLLDLYGVRVVVCGDVACAWCVQARCLRSEMGGRPTIVGAGTVNTSDLPSIRSPNQLTRSLRCMRHFN